MDRSRQNGDLRLARLSADADRARFALRRGLRDEDEAERALAARLRALDAAIADARFAAKAELRLAWRDDARRDAA